MLNYEHIEILEAEQQVSSNFILHISQKTHSHNIYFGQNNRFISHKARRLRHHFLVPTKAAILFLTIFPATKARHAPHKVTLATHTHTHTPRQKQTHLAPSLSRIHICTSIRTSKGYTYTHEYSPFVIFIHTYNVCCY